MIYKNICKIGLSTRCDETGCEWAKQFNKNCITIKNELKNNKIQREKAKAAIKITDHTDLSKKKKGHFVKEEKKYIEINKFANNTPPPTPKKKKKKKKSKSKYSEFRDSITPLEKLSDDELFSRITVLETEDWLKKIKII